MSYAVAARTAEFGIRMALGAERSGVLAAVFRKSLIVVAYGLAAGIPAVLASSRLLSSLLFGVGATDPATVSSAAALLACVAAAASLVPAWRASRVDPMIALRCE
jgi:ABC-type antimicrobial peptide transport system permease subunit